MVKRGSRRRWRALGVRLLVLGASVMLGLVLVEGLLRTLDGHALFTLRLSRSSNDSTPSPDPRLDAVFERFRAGIVQRPDLDPAWLLLPFAPPQGRARRPDLDARLAQWGRVGAAYVYNRRYLEEASALGTIESLLKGMRPETLWVFEPVGDSIHPPYRYPRSVTFPSGLSLNAFGWRGPDLALEKPPRTVRVACVGASTTVCAHDHPVSWPEALQVWLQRWGDSLGLDVRFEVINGGREGIHAADAAAILEDEVLPLAPDYVVFYEGANHLVPGDWVRFDDPADRHAPPASSDALGWISGLAPFSATARRLDNLRRRMGSNGVEPSKPRQTVVFPDGLDEHAPDLSKLGSFMHLDRVLAALDRMRDALAPSGGRLLVTSYCWLTAEGQRLDPVRDRHIADHLDRRLHPVSRDSLRRLTDFQNRVFSTWAETHGLPFLPIADRFPREPALNTDAIHHTFPGDLALAWCVLECLTPIIEDDLRHGRVPVKQDPVPRDHPAWRPVTEVLLEGLFPR